MQIILFALATVLIPHKCFKRLSTRYSCTVIHCRLIMSVNKCIKIFCSILYFVYEFLAGYSEDDPRFWLFKTSLLINTTIVTISVRVFTTMLFENVNIYEVYWYTRSALIIIHVSVKHLEALFLTTVSCKLSWLYFVLL